MNNKPIDTARNADLRGSLPALQRAAQRARELSVSTGTELIVSRNGVIERIKPKIRTAATGVAEPQTPCGERP
ncbi:MAG: hypothetical protein Q8L45_08240 [Xanthomonadaceae bacterium]|nr:hypothetical protein [Xanthomonadaceae bacterium]